MEKLKGLAVSLDFNVLTMLLQKELLETVQIPDQYNNSEPTTSDLDGWFGNKSGCIGIMRTATQSRLYARRFQTVWKYEILS